MDNLVLRIVFATQREFVKFSRQRKILTLARKPAVLIGQMNLDSSSRNKGLFQRESLKRCLTLESDSCVNESVNGPSRIRHRQTIKIFRRRSVHRMKVHR